MFLLNLQNLLGQAFPNSLISIEGASLYLTDVVCVGVVKTTDCNNYAFIDQIYVKTARQGQGVGTLVGAIKL